MHQQSTYTVRNVEQPISRAKSGPRSNSQDPRHVVIPVLPHTSSPATNLSTAHLPCRTPDKPWLKQGSTEPKPCTTQMTAVGQLKHDHVARHEFGTLGSHEPQEPSTADSGHQSAGFRGAGTGVFTDRVMGRWDGTSMLCTVTLLSSNVCTYV